MSHWEKYLFSLQLWGLQDYVRKHSNDSLNCKSMVTAWAIYLQREVHWEFTSMFKPMSWSYQATLNQWLISVRCMTFLMIFALLNGSMLNEQRHRQTDSLTLPISDFSSLSFHRMQIHIISWRLFFFFFLVQSSFLSLPSFMGIAHQYSHSFLTIASMSTF